MFKAGFRMRDKKGRLLRGDDGGFIVKPKRWSESVNVVTNGDGNAFDVNGFNRSMRPFFVEHGLGEWTGKTKFKSSVKHVDGSDMYATRNTGYRGVSLKSFRKLFLTELAMAGVPVSTLQAIAGHTNPNTSLKYYIKATEDSIREAFTTHAMHVATERDVGVYDIEDIHAYEVAMEDLLADEGE